MKKRKATNKPLSYTTQRRRSQYNTIIVRERTVMGNSKNQIITSSRYILMIYLHHKSFDVTGYSAASAVNTEVSMPSDQYCLATIIA